MPLLMCPNCQVGMREVERDGVRIDFCPQCRGVWLDQGELELLIKIDNEAVAQAAMAAPGYPPPPNYPVAQHNRHYQYANERTQGHHEHGKHGHDRDYGPGQYPHKKRSLKDMFDIFD